MSLVRDLTPDDATGSIEVREVEQDVEMKDCSSGGHTDTEGDATEDGDPNMFQIIQQLTAHLSTVEEDGEELAAGFQRIPNRRTLPDYFEVITDPIAFSTIRSKIQKKQYLTIAEFVKDVAQICHNAQVYNRPSAPIFGAAVRLREIFHEQLQKLVAKGDIAPDDAKLPDLGELPPVEDSPSLPSEDEDEEDEDESSDDEDESSDDDERQRKRRRARSRGRQSFVRPKEPDEDKEDDAYKKRGRPPMVQTPTEARISSILRSLRKFKDDEGNLLVTPFEKLPDKTTMADYYQSISNPIALDNIKKKAKRKKYRHVDDLLLDIELMFENAKLYNEDDSPLYLAAVELQTQSRILAEQEKAKPDDDFRDEDGKLPLSEIQHNGQSWKVGPIIGDWVHIRNPNDLAKPIVAQIFRTWQDRAGQKWINACWYYRPEQTVHRYEKHFFEHEVVKTGQYRDHQISELLDRCFVMFVTRFNKGRPRGLPSDKDVYVCESRYNEERFRFNKIKTWASCVPDEVRDKDYEMDLFEVPRRMRKVPSPIKHLLREDAKDTDDLPRPTWGSPNAPPIVGAVHRRPPEANESPPPEPTPPPPLMPTASHMSSESATRPSAASVTPEMSMDPTVRLPQAAGPVPSPSQVNQYSMQATGHFQPVTPAGGGHVMQQTPVPIPQPPQAAVTPQMSIRPMQYQQQQQQPNYTHNFGSSYSSSPAAFTHPPPMANQAALHYNQLQLGRMPFNASTGSGSNPTNVYNPPRPPEVYTLPDNINEALHPQIRKGFQHDSAGRVLFFVGPPMDRTRERLSPQSVGLGHSIKYIAGRRNWLAEREKKRQKRDESQAARPENILVTSHSLAQSEEGIASQAADAIDQWFQRFTERGLEWKQDAGLEGWGGGCRT
ncbi:Bromo adjacent like protein [Metarhizium robertsii ARSEF 23]|uniref:Bromo adjacent like protein n=1 Tax=Metarhizium robertsii (strain ARSEF 23 / ATCC MYA-3075) TaxID=655844 RepID=E9EWR8_METRA|nr:Bromo adjacent like protein [Metarhizium robertsii ARSEF 23]EFY99538.1 Bromo adjacent like protein [Metarhizium robertsii ARSEF 23]